MAPSDVNTPVPRDNENVREGTGVRDSKNLFEREQHIQTVFSRHNCNVMTTMNSWAILVLAVFLAGKIQVSLFFSLVGTINNNASQSAKFTLRNVGWNVAFKVIYQSPRVFFLHL